MNSTSTLTPRSARATPWPLRVSLAFAIVLTAFMPSSHARQTADQPPASGHESRPDADPAGRNAARITLRSRAPAYHDFLRVTWVSPGLQVTTLGKPKAKRVFFTASSFFHPPASVEELVSLVGNTYRKGQDLVVMVCRPPAVPDDPIAPVLATWSQLLPRIKSDLGDCTGAHLNNGEKEVCEIAGRYRDRRHSVYADGLKSTFDLASELMQTAERQAALWDNFSIGTAFTGLGFTVWGSSTPSETIPRRTSEVLRRSVIPEYVLRNATLRDANCHCVQLPESEALPTSAVDPEQVWARGSLTPEGACLQLPQLD